jgi:hypothetical protein
VVIGRALNEATGFDKESLNRSMKMTVLTMRPNTNFKQWKRSFLTFMSFKAAYLIPQLAIRESGVSLDEAAQTYAYALLVHNAIENKRVCQAVQCIIAAPHGCATLAWDILCERLDGRSFVRSMLLLENLMLRQRPGPSLTEYVNFMRQTFDDYIETCEMIDGLAAIHPHHLGLLMPGGISRTGPLGQAEECVINAFDTNYLLSAHEVMAIIRHMAHNMDEELLTLTSQLRLAKPLSSLPLLVLVAITTMAVATTTVADAAVVACPISPLHVAVLTISCRHARPRMTHY